MSRLARALHAVAGAAVLALGGLLLLAAVRLVGQVRDPAWLEPLGGAWIDDGWSRSARAALFAATGLTLLGIVRVPGGRRLLAAALLLVAALALAFAAGSLDLLGIWSGLAVAHVAAPLAFIAADERRSTSRHALAVLLLGGLSSGVLATACLAFASLSGATHLIDLGFLITRFDDATPLALTALRTAAVAVALLAAWAPFHLALPELWGEGSSPLAGWLAISWPWAGWGVIVRLSGGLGPALEEWSFDAAAASSLFLAAGALLPSLAALAEERAGRLLALLAVGTLGELLLAMHGSGVDARAVAAGLWGTGLAWVLGAAALAGVRARTGDDRFAALAGLGNRAPRTALALTLAALTWTGLPGTFSLVARGELWRGAVGALGGLGLAPAPGPAPLPVAGGAEAGGPPMLAAAVVLVGGLLRLFAVARLLRVLYFGTPEASPEPGSAAVAAALAADPGPAPRPRFAWAARWVLIFLAALSLELALGLGPEAWRLPLSALPPPGLGG